MNPRSRNAGYTISKKDLHNIYHGRTRILKPYEIFAKLYPVEVEDEKKRRCDAGGIGGRQQLSVWHEAAKDLYRQATDEQIDAVEKEVEKHANNAAPMEMDEAPGSPRAFLRFVFV
jgi:hypothetical protein